MRRHKANKVLQQKILWLEVNGTELHIWLVFAGVTEVKCRRDFICSINSVDSVAVLFEAAAAAGVAAAF